MKNILYIAILLIVLSISCTKEDNTNTPEPKSPSGFVPPSINYWILNGDTNFSSADAATAGIMGNSFGLSKPFGSYSNYRNLSVQFNSDKMIRDSIPEGSYKIFHIAKGTEPPKKGTDSALLQVTVVPYYYWGNGGVVYISKKNNKLRFTVDVTLNLKGVKYPDIHTFNQTATTKFSWEEL
ncbi:MAG: hypothetical protein IT243_03540 [Bacteroidia bacterium]|nr:hypothetical protein [Bacteroidia bacterium]